MILVEKVVKIFLLMGTVFKIALKSLGWNLYLFINTFSAPFYSDFSRPEGIPCSLFNQFCCVCSTFFPPAGEVLELVFFKSFHYLILEGQGIGNKWKPILPSGPLKPTISKFCHPSYMVIMTYNFKISSLLYGFWHYSFNIVSVGRFRNIVLIILCCKTLFRK